MLTQVCFAGRISKSLHLVFDLLPLFSLYFPELLTAGVVGSSGLEPPTLRLSGARSNHLSYEPMSFRAAGLSFARALWWR